MIKYLITHGCDATDQLCHCKLEIEADSVQEIIEYIESIEQKYRVFRIEKILLDDE